MRYFPMIVVYAAMLAFDAFVLAGTAWLIAERNWSAWWFLFAAVMCAGSNPKNLIRVWRGEPEQK